jgi:hypothetical protein
MSFERHRPSWPEIERNLLNARVLRSAYVWTCLVAMGCFIAQTWRSWRRRSEVHLDVSAQPIGEQRSS